MRRQGIRIGVFALTLAACNAIGSFRSSAPAMSIRKVGASLCDVPRIFNPRCTRPSKAGPEAKYLRFTRSTSVKLMGSLRGIWSTWP